MHIICFFTKYLQYMYQDSSYLLLQVGTHADVGNVEFQDNVCDMECVGVFLVLDIIVVLKVIEKMYTIQNHSWNSNPLQSKPQHDG